MDEQVPLPAETSGQAPIGLLQVGWGFWALLVLAFAVAGALSYVVSSVAPLASYSLPPVAMLIFGLLAGAVQGYALRRQVPPPRRWILTSLLAGFAAACVGFLSTGLADSAIGMYAGWAYAWAAYGAVLGLMVQRILPGRRLILASITGWATAGIVGGTVSLLLDVLRVSGTTDILFQFPSSLSRDWSMTSLIAAGAVCGAIGGAFYGAALVAQAQQTVQPPDHKAAEKRDAKLVNLAGIASGLVAAVLCTLVAPVIVTIVTQGSLESLDMPVFFLNLVAGTPLCIPTYALVSIPLGIGSGRVGLAVARGRGSDPKPWVWLGAAVGGVAGCLLGFLVAFAIGHTG